MEVGEDLTFKGTDVNGEEFFGPAVYICKVAIGHIIYMVNEDRNIIVTSLPEEEKTYLLRMSGEYSLTLTASSEKEAIEMASKLPVDAWEVSWSEIEAVCD